MSLKNKSIISAEMAEYVNKTVAATSAAAPGELLSAIAKLKPSEQQPTTPPSAPRVDPSAQKRPLVAWDGLIVPADDVTLVMLAIVELAKTNKKLKALLDVFKFQMKDVNGNSIYPTHAKKRSRRS